MTDTDLLDFIEVSIKERNKDTRYLRNDYMVSLGTLSFSLGKSQKRTFRELIHLACIDQITARLKQ